MRIRLVVAKLVNSASINGQANIAAGARRINMSILLTNRKLLSVHSESVRSSSSEASALIWCCCLCYHFASELTNHHAWYFNSLPNEKFLDWSKLKAFADDKIKLAEKLTFLFGRVEYSVGKGENAVYQQFLLFSQCFHNVFKRLLI